MASGSRSNSSLRLPSVWTHIISLKRGDAERLGFDHSEAWRSLLRLHQNEIAEAVHIPIEHLRWYAAFHDVGEHPHVHMIAWSTDPKEGFLNQNGIRDIRSKLTNDVFKQVLLHIYEQKSESRDELVHESRRAMLELVQQMQNGVCNHPELEPLMLQLSQTLETIKGKKSYRPICSRMSIGLQEHLFSIRRRDRML